MSGASSMRSRRRTSSDLLPATQLPDAHPATIEQASRPARKSRPARPSRGRRRPPWPARRPAVPRRARPSSSARREPHASFVVGSKSSMRSKRSPRRRPRINQGDLELTAAVVHVTAPAAAVTATSSRSATTSYSARASLAWSTSARSCASEVARSRSRPTVARARVVDDLRSSVEAALAASQSRALRASVKRRPAGVRALVRDLGAQALGTGARRGLVVLVEELDAIEAIARACARGHEEREAKSPPPGSMWPSMRQRPIATSVVAPDELESRVARHPATLVQSAS